METEEDTNELYTVTELEDWLEANTGIISVTLTLARNQKGEPVVQVFGPGISMHLVRNCDFDTFIHTIKRAYEEGNDPKDPEKSEVRC